MKHPIDLTSPIAAIAYLRSFPDEHIVEIPGHLDPNPKSAAVVALEVVTGEDSNTWASSHNRWEWSIEQILQTLGPQPGDRMIIPSEEGIDGIIERIDGDEEYHLLLTNGNRKCYSRSRIEYALPSA